MRYGIASDRGRIVREAIAVLLADLDARGKDSLLARRIANENDTLANSRPIAGNGEKPLAGNGEKPLADDSEES